MHIALFEPEIPPNTGNIIRLCANTGSELHLIHPLGFDMNEKQLRRAGLDYHQHVKIHEYENLEAFLKTMNNKRIIAIETWGTQRYDHFKFKADDVLLLSKETTGLPKKIMDAPPKDQILYIPMKKDIRSVNLSNTVAIVIFEAWRQLGFHEMGC